MDDRAGINILVTPRFVDVPPLCGIPRERRPSVAMTFLRAQFGPGRLVRSPLDGFAYRWHPEGEVGRLVKLNMATGQGANDET